MLPGVGVTTRETCTLLVNPQLVAIIFKVYEPAGVEVLVLIDRSEPIEPPLTGVTVVGPNVPEALDGNPVTEKVTGRLNGRLL